MRYIKWENDKGVSGTPEINCEPNGEQGSHCHLDRYLPEWRVILREVRIPITTILEIQNTFPAPIYPDRSCSSSGRPCQMNNGKRKIQHFMAIYNAFIISML